MLWPYWQAWARWGFIPNCASAVSRLRVAPTVSSVAKNAVSFTRMIRTWSARDVRNAGNKTRRSSSEPLPASFQLDDIMGRRFALAGGADTNEAGFFAQLGEVGRAEV